MSVLGGEDLESACRLLLECYGREELEQLLRLRFALRLDWIVRDAGLAQQVAELLDFAGRHRLTGRLLKEAAEFPPPRARLRPLAERFPPDPGGSAQPVRALIDDAVRTFSAVPAMLRAGDGVRERVVPFLSAYEQASARVDVLHRYKGLHECLQHIQLQYREIADSALQVAGGEPSAGRLETYADQLEDAAGKCEEPLRALPNPHPEQTWLGSLRRAIASLRAAAAAGGAAQAPGAAKDAVRLLDRILARDPIRLHGLILAQVDVIPISQLVFSLRAIRDATGAGGGGDAGAAEGGGAVRDQLVDGLAALEALHLRLAWLIAEHTAWQNLDNSLRVAAESWHELLALDVRRAKERSTPAGAAAGGDAGESQIVYVTRLLEDWPDVADKFAAVRAGSAAGRRLERMVGYAGQIGAAGAAPSVVLDAFPPFAHLALVRFIEVDQELLALANELSRIARPLQAILSEMRS